MSKISDELEAIKAAERAREFNRRKEEASNPMGRITQELNIYQKFFRSFGAVCVWLWWNFGNPFFNKFKSNFTFVYS